MKRLCSVVLVGMVILLGSTAPSLAWGRGGGFHGGFHGGSHGGFHHGFHHDGHAFVHSHVFIGAPFFFGDPFWWGPWPTYAAPPAVVQSSPPVYIQQQPTPSAYWYYCQKPEGYYPYIKDCPGGWLTVVPPAQ